MKKTVLMISFFGFLFAQRAYAAEEHFSSLEEIAAMSQQEAKEEILNQAENDLTYELAIKIKHYEEEFRAKSESKAIDIITTSIERCSLDQIVEAVNRVGAAPGDLVAILEALKEAGALHAELIVI